MTRRHGTILAALALLGACAGPRETATDTAGLTSAIRSDSIGSPEVATRDSAVAADRPASKSGGGEPNRPSAAGSASRPAPPAVSGGVVSDTVRGVVAVVGSTPMTNVVVRPAGGRSVTVSGPLATEIGRASGAEVEVRGRKTGERTIEATGYAVRSVDGLPALTGRLAADGDRVILVSDDGLRRVIANPPPVLRQHIGARVWLTGDPATSIVVFGVLRPAS